MVVGVGGHEGISKRGLRMKIRFFAVVACCGMLGGGAFAAGGTPGGISDISSIQTSKKLPKGGLKDRQIGAATDQTPSGKGTQLPTSLCDFVGFQQMESVNNAYAGGSGSAGTVRSNIGVSYSGASVLNTWNGTGAPSAGVLYNGTNGIITLSDTTNGSGWRQIDLSACNSVTLTVQTFSATNAGGTALQSFTIPANIAAAPFSTWTARQFTFAQMAKSVRISGTTDRWGVDNIALTGGCPAPTSSSDDCNGNGLSDACEIAMGLVADCNANGKPDSCDIAGAAPAQGAVQWRVADGGNGHWYKRVEATDITWQAARQACEALQGHLATVNSSAEQNWLFAQFVNGQATCSPASWATPRAVWIGLYQDTASPSYSEPAGGWRWVTNEPFTFANWSPGEPNNVDFPANYAGMYGNGAWDDTPNDAGIYCHAGYLIEWDTTGSLADCNANGIPDSCEIANGSAADCNRNGIPDACDIAGGIADCNGNGQLDSCELANGTAIDQNGNGIPDACDPTPSLTLTANAAACNAVGSSVQVDARLSGVLNLVVAGQLVIDWDPSKLQLLSAGAGDAPYNNLYTVNQSAGQAVILVSAAPGGSGTTAASVIVSRLQFQVLGGSCDGSGTAVTFGTYAGLSTTFTNGQGSSLNPSLIGSTGFVVDDGAPVISDVPANQYAQAQAGEGGFAILSIGTPTVTDACAPGLTATGTRSDGRALNAAWPSGTTTVTWSATDPCGNVSLAYTTVTVDPTNTMDFQVAWSGTGFSGSMSRSLSLTMFGGLGTQSRTAMANASNGNAAFSVTDLPVDTYTCATIEDSARTLRRRVSVSDAGVNWSATGALISGDIINDEVIDVLDWGAYVVRNANADLNGDGEINTTDGDLILANFGLRGDSVCGGSFTEPPAPRTEISVSDLVAMGLPELAGADLNGDGWVDGRDMDMFQN